MGHGSRPATNIPLREGRAAIVGDREIAIFNLGDRFLAVDNRCPHRGGPLCDGIVAGGVRGLPAARAGRSNLRNRRGRASGERETCVRSYPTRVEAGILMIELPCASAIAEDGQAA